MNKLYLIVKNYFLLLFLFGISLLYSSNLFAQNTRFKHLSVDDGLAQNTINSIAQDKYGFIWFATGAGAGLNRYDGTEFKTFRNDPNDSTTISDNSILFVYVDSGNDLWIDTRWSGLNKMDLKTHKITRIKINAEGKGELNNQSLLCVAEDKNGLLYFGTSCGINVYNKKSKKFTYIQNDPKDTTTIAHNSVRSLTIDKQGKLWMGHTYHGGVSCYDTKNIISECRKTNANAKRNIGEYI